MNNTNFNLIVLHHEEVFATRELALSYLTNYYKPHSLDAEPVIVKYGDEQNPNVILAFGTSNNVPGSFFAFDIAEANEQIEELANAIGNFDDMTEIINGIIKSTGLTLDDNKIHDKISYDPDQRDNLIRDAVNVAEAVDLISKFAQQNKISVEDSNAISLIFTVNPNGGMNLKAELIISNNGDSVDDVNFNNNIIGVKNDGVYAASHLAYDEPKHELIFTTSGYKNGRFQDDAIVQKVNLGKHTKLVANNDGKSVELLITEDSETGISTISANLQVSDRENNILNISDGKAYVEGLARNIKYGETTVANKLTELVNKTNLIETEVESAAKTAHIEGGVTDTLETQVATLADGGAKVTGNVRLGADNSIVVRDGGLQTNIEIDVNNTTNQLIVKIGNKTVTKQLPGVELFESAEYNDENEELVITFRTGNTLVIPIHSIIHTWNTNNDENSPITLTKTVVSGDVDVLSGNIKLRSTDNLIGVENGKLYVSEQTIDNKVNTETSRATSSENEIKASIQNLSNTVTDSFEEVNAKLNNEKLERTNKDTELNSKITTVTQSVATEKERAETAEEANAARIEEVAASIGTSSSQVVEQANTYTDTKVLAEKNAREAKEAEIENNIATAVRDASDDATEKANAAETQANAYTDTKVSNLATKASLQETENKATQNASDIATLNSTVGDMKFITEESDTVRMTMEKETGAEMRTLTSEVKIKSLAGTENANIIKSDANGIYATVTLTYDKAANKLTFNDGNGDKELELNNFGILQDAFYESATKSIVLIVKKDDETTERISFPVADLVNVWDVQNNPQSPIVLTKATGENGDTLSANVSILNNSKNLLTIDNGSLFADGDANAHFALWGETQTTVQGALNSIKNRIDVIDAIEHNIGDLGEVLDNLQLQVTNNTQNITELQNSSSDIQTTINEFDERLTNAESEIAEVKENLNELKQQLGDISGDNTVAERLSEIEQMLANLIDLGEYSI